MLPKEDRSYATRSELLDQLQTLLAGRVAEEVVLKEISTGAQNDIERASALVRSMITQYGMSDALGPIAFGKGQNHQVFLGRDINHERNYSEEVACEIDKEVRKYIDTAYENCRRLLTDHIDKLHLIAKYLIERETLEAAELKKLMEGGTLDDKPEDDGDKPDEGTPAPIMPEAPLTEDAIVAPQPKETAEKESGEPKVVFITRDFNRY